MAKTHSWKVYKADNEYIASAKHPEYAAMVLAGLGQDGATIRLGHAKKNTVWTEGVDGHAWESYDQVVDTAFEHATSIT